MSSDIICSLRSCGFFRSLDSLAALYRHAELLVENAGTGRKPAYEALISYIPSQTAQFVPALQLVIDIGGTSTKVGTKRIGTTREADWSLLFELDNNALKEESIKASGLTSFAQCLAKHIQQSLTKVGVSPGHIQACALVWSNAFSSQPPDTSGSITGLVCQKEMYHKGEWFNRDLKNGTDLGQVFKSAFEGYDINITKFLLGNDTPLTMKALNGAHGGMVASTGLNGTLVKDLKDLGHLSSSQAVICNAEMGGRFFMNREFLSDFDISGERKGTTTIEALVAGGFLPRVFIDHILGLAGAQQTELMPLANYLSAQPDNGYSFFCAQDMTGFMNNPQTLLCVQTDEDLFSEQVLQSLSTLATQIFIRAARLAAVIAYSTVCNQVTDNAQLVIALDSSLCRSTPIFNNNFLDELAKSPASSQNCTIKAVLLEPVETATGRISVPMQGAANALACL